MKKALLILPLLFFLFSFLIVPQASAQSQCCVCGDGSQVYTNTTNQTTCADACDGHGGTTSRTCTSSSGSSANNPSGQVTLSDPLNLGGNPEELYARLVRALLAFVGIASLVTFVYAGFLFLISSGNQEKVKKAKDTMFYSIIGVVVSIASYTILSFIFRTLEGN